MKHFTLARWVAVLRQGKRTYRTTELMRLSGRSLTATRRAADRLARQGVLLGIGQNLYVNLLGASGAPCLEEIAALVYPPSYVSLESALFMHGILDQAPQILTCVTTNKPRRVRTKLGRIDYHHLKPALFFGYDTRDRIMLAAPEKAALDHVYLHLQNGVSPDVREWNWDALSLDSLWSMADRYPKTVQAALAPGLRRSPESRALPDASAPA